ncbi:MAG: hypothetical protein ACRAU9_13785, partial [Shewanella xiamenensis]
MHKIVHGTVTLKRVGRRLTFWLGTVTTSVSTPGSWLSGNAVGLTGLEFIETPIVKFCPTFIVVTLNHVLAKV